MLQFYKGSEPTASDKRQLSDAETRPGQRSSLQRPFQRSAKPLTFHSSKVPDGLMCPHIHYLTGTRDSLQGIKRTEREADLHLYLVPRLRKCGNSPPCPLCRHGVHGHNFTFPHLAYTNIRLSLALCLHYFQTTG